MSEPTVRKCAYRKCPDKCEVPEIFCVEHWRMIPTSAQNEFFDAWLEGDKHKLGFLTIKSQVFMRGK